MKSKVKKKNIRSLPLLLLAFLFTTSLLIGLVAYQINNFQSKAQGVNTCRCTDPGKCFPDGCSRDNQKAPSVCEENDLGPNMPAEDNYLCYNPPDCCDAMVTEDNAYRCCWVERGFCRKEQCAKLTGRQARCGWYWDDRSGEGYGCSRVNVPPIGVPTNPPPVVPTNPPVLPTEIVVIPTSLPVVFPTSTPIPATVSIPTTYIPPTSAPVYSRPTQPPVVIYSTPTLTPKPTSPPVIGTIIKETNNFWQKLKVNLTQFITTILP